MKNTAYKRHLRRIRRNCGLYSIMIERLKKLPKNRQGIIKFPFVFRIMGGGFHINKQQSWDLLMLLDEFGMIKMFPYHGIKIIKK
jgi:hypothetical protein